MTLDMTTAALTAALVVPLSVTAALLLQRLLRQRHQLDPSALVRKLRIDDPGRPLESIAEDFVNVIRHASGSQHAFIILLDRFNHVVFRQAGNVTPTAQSLIRRAPAVIPLMNRTQAPDGRLDIVATVLRPGRFSPRALNLDHRYRRTLRRFQLMLREMGREGWELFVPIRHGAGTLGCAVLWGKEGNRPFRETELSFLTSLFFVFTTSLTARLNSDEVRETRNRSEKITRFFSTHGLAQRQISDTLHMVHSSPIMKDIRGAIDRAANAGEPLLITGEVGTGKELVARLIHALGPHKAEPFELIKCASVPSGGWEHSPALAPADHVKGVVFFDDVAAIPVPVQAELLRMLQQTGHMPFQFIFGAAALPGDLAAVGGVDPGLLQMISGATIDMHPLRHRREDIPGIISHFLERYATEMGSPVREIDEEAMEALVRYRWPGNIVELENVLTRALAGAGSMTLTLRDLPVLVQESKSGADGTRFTGASADDAITGTFEELTQAYAKELILKALRRANGNKSRAAAILGIKRGRLIYQLKELGIQDTEAAAGAEP